VSMTPAEAYEQCLVPAIFEPWARRALQAHPPAPGDRVLDVACGTGIGARLAARLVGPTGSVVGVDADGGMLAVARSLRGTRLPAAPTDPEHLVLYATASEGQAQPHRAGGVACRWRTPLGWRSNRSGAYGVRT